jgi:hypothetical protein
LRSTVFRFACALALFALPARADAPKPAAAAPSEPAIKVEATEGTELSKKDEAAVRKLLSDYLAALQKREYEKAGEMLDRPSLLKAVDPMIATIAPDSTQYNAARRKIFGVSTADSLAHRKTGPLFASLMAYMMTTNPNAADVLARATIEVLAARRRGDYAHVAYQVTLPSPEPGGMPLEQVTAQQLKKVDGKWKIMFRLEQ